MFWESNHPFFKFDADTLDLKKYTDGLEATGYTCE